jgi:threonine dehydratase
MTPLPNPEQLALALRAVRARFAASPLESWNGLSWKLETELPTRAFKVRGAVVAFDRLAASGATGLVAASAGNHGLGLAWATEGSGMPLTVVVPRECPEVKRSRLAASPHVELLVCQTPGYDAAEAMARELATATGRPFVSPFDDTWVMAGNGGTAALEVFDACPDAATWVVPVGGGGLLAGVLAARRLLAERGEAVPEVVAVQSEASPAFAASLRDGRAWLHWPAAATLAEGLEGGTGAAAVDAALRAGVRCILVSEAGIAEAMQRCQARGWRVEGSAAVVEAARASAALAAFREPIVGWLTGANVA